MGDGAEESTECDHQEPTDHTSGIEQESESVTDVEAKDEVYIFFATMCSLCFIMSCVVHVHVLTHVDTTTGLPS